MKKKQESWPRLQQQPLSGGSKYLTFLHHLIIRKYKKIALLLILTVVFTDILSQNIKSPEEFLGYELGTRFTRHHRVVDYFKYISESVPTIDFHQYGETYENRPLIYITIASASNYSRLDDIRENNLGLTGLETGNPDQAKTAIVWLSYNVHGNESVSMEASMQTLYELADNQIIKTQKYG